MTPHTTESRNNSILIITGPTGSGKSAIAHRLADQYPISIISADSRQILKGFDIGSAKPSQHERDKYDYRLLDVIEPGERFSAYDFKEIAENEIQEILKSGRIPLVCGGTGLYLRALTDGIFEAPSADPGLRERLEDEAQELGAERFHAKLQQIDPIEAELIHPHNIVRVTRALEIYYLTGRTKSELSGNPQLAEVKFQFKQLALTPPITTVYQRINARVLSMLEHGWIEETNKLIAQYGAETVRQARAIGYGFLVDYLENKLTLEHATELIQRDTRRFAKRQMTWLRGVESAKFIADSEDLFCHSSEHIKGRLGATNRG